MQRLALLAVATCVHGLGLSWAAVGVSDTTAVFDPALAFPPLDSLRVTGGYGEVRSNHFHAGFDFSTDGRVGAPVRAPLAGSVERVRASGVGYGRSLYLRADDGRLLVFGHLDAFAPALAAYVDSAQRVPGLYEQDLWPASGRFRFAPGETLAWSGESGGGGPHLHFEIRHDDFAMHPLRGGLARATYSLPRLASLTLEPLDADSRVAGGVWPRTFALRAGAGDTLEVEGRVRAVLRSVSGVPGAGDAPAWSTRLEWGDASVEARLDSISWAGEMSEIDVLVDRGRVAGSGGLVMWAPAGFRPRFLRTSAPLEREAGTIEVKRGDAPRTLRLTAREPGGATVERFVVLRPPPGYTAVPPGLRAPRAGKPGDREREPRWSFTALPGSLVRVRVLGAPPLFDGARLGRAIDSSGGRYAQWDGAGWTALVRGDGLPDRMGFRLTGRREDGTAWSAVSECALWPAGADSVFSPAPGVTLSIGPGDVFEPGLVLTRVRAGSGAHAQGLDAVGVRVQVRPDDLPLRRALRVALPLAAGDSAGGLGVYRRRGADKWEWMGARYEHATHSLAAESGQTGEFAVMRDTLAPQVRVFAIPRRGAAGAYSRWELAATVTEHGSGVDASASEVVVDGVRVPSEWDPEARQLRWRPLVPPARGRHEYTVRVVDRAGNPTSRRGSFVLDSARH